MSKQKSKMNTKTRMIVGCGVLTAVACVLQFVELSIPIIPSFIKLDFSDLPALIGAFAFGPFAGVAIELLKNLIHLPFGSTMAVGELSNFLLGASFTLTAGLIYKHKKTKKSALLAGIIGALVMAVISLPINYFIIYPLYYNILGFPEVAILSMYQLILPSIKNMLEALLVFNVPFTFVKGLISVVVSMLIYQPLRPFLKGKNDTKGY